MKNSRKMVKLIVNNLLGLKASEKDEAGSHIVKMLGGDTEKKISGEFKLKGNQDGGLDGRIGIYEKITMQTTYRSEITLVLDVEEKEELMVAGFNVKLQNKNVGRAVINEFVTNLIRERIITGIVIGKGITKEARESIKVAEVRGTNIYFLSLEDIYNNLNLTLSELIYKKYSVKLKLIPDKLIGQIV